MNKLPELYQILYDTRVPYDCLFFTETWLRSTTPSSLLDPKGEYMVFRKDRSDKAGGGVCAFVSKKLRCLECVQFNVTTDPEIICFDVLMRSDKYRFIVFYRCPKEGLLGRTEAETLCNALQSRIVDATTTFILADLNCPNVDWSLPVQCGSYIDRLFLNFMSSNGFKQCVTEPTRQNNILDLVFVNEPILMSDINVSTPFSSSDHNSVEFNLCIESGTRARNNPTSTSTYKMYLWSEGDYVSMCAYLREIKWADLLTVNFTADGIWTAFCDILDEAIELFVPSVTKTTERKARRRAYPKHIRVLLQRKRAIWSKCRRKQNDLDLKAKYSEISANCRLAIQQHEIMLEKRVIDSNSVGAFYRFVNAKSCNRTGVGPLLGTDGQPVVNDKDKADVLNSFFGSVCVTDDGSRPSVAAAVPSDTGKSISTVEFDICKILKAARRIKTKSKYSSGPDGYPVMLIKELINVLADPLSLYYNTFMSIGCLPRVWKAAVVVPAYKKGSSSDPSNYRPISQTSVFCKLMERVIVNEMSNYLMSVGVISKHQHGFITKRSTTTNLLETLNDWTLSIDNRLTQTAVYVDFARAFDSVPPDKLQIKLEAYGICGDLLSLIMDFLRDRTQVTKVGHELSNPVILTSGVVQGSCLGPLLFLIYINDLPEIFNSTATPKLYADDLKLYSTLNCFNDEITFRQNLDNLVAWSKTWQLSISIKKCQHFIIGGRRSKPTTAKAAFSLGGNVLPTPTLVNDLGILIDPGLTFSAHIDKITSNAFQRSYLIHKCFQSRDTDMLLKAFKTYVRPLVESNSPVWSPHLVKDIRKVESVQRRFTKKLPGLYDESYLNRLRTLRLERLDVRRLRFDILFVYKMLFGLVSLDFGMFFNLSPAENTRGHRYKLLLPSCNTDIRKYFFSVRIIKVWNELPASTDFGSLGRFINSISKVDLVSYCIDF